MAEYNEDDEDQNDDDALASEEAAAELSQTKPKVEADEPPEDEERKEHAIDKELADSSDEADLDQEMDQSNPQESPDDQLAAAPPEAGAPQSQKESMLAALEAIRASKEGIPSKLSQYQDYMNQYQQLQNQQRKSDLVNGLIAAGGKVGQSIAGKYSGNFVPDQTGNQMLAKMAERPTQQFELGQAVQGRGMQLQSEMAANDPNSPQSKLVRSYVEKRLGLKLDDDVSASDAQMLLKTVGRPVQETMRFVNLTNTNPDSPDYGKTIMGKLSRTGAMYDSKGNPLSDNYVIQNAEQVIKTLMVIS